MIKSLKTKNNLKLKDFATLDIETVEHEGVQVPVCITLSYNMYDIFPISRTLALSKSDLESGTIIKAVHKLWLEFIILSKQMFSRNQGNNYVFVHKR